MANNVIIEMQNGNKKAIINGLFHSGAIYRMNAIAYATLFKFEDAVIIRRLKELQNDNKGLDGYTVASFAKAALVLLGAEVYNGNDEEVKRLVNSGFEFMK